MAEEESKDILSNNRKSGVPQKFRHVYGRETNRDNTFYNIQPNSTSNMDSALVTCNQIFWAVPWVGGGGPVYVSRLDAVGKVEPTVALVNGHRAPVVSLGFSPFNDYLLATGSDDQHIKIWQLPEQTVGSESQHKPLQGIGMNADDARCDLAGHTGSVKTIDFHPVADQLLVTSGTDMMIRFWDLENQIQSLCIGEGVFRDSDNIFNLSFNYMGNLLSVSSRDYLYLMDPRARENSGIVSSCVGHVGRRGQRAVWCTSPGQSDTKHLLSVGTGKVGERQLILWDIRNFESPLVTKTLDSSSGLLFPLYDEGTSTAFLTARGDRTLKIVEINTAEGSENILNCNDFQPSGDPTCGIGMLPKRVCDVRSVEVCRLLRLTTTSLEPISFILPRADKLKEYFQDDVFLPARSKIPTLTCEQWLSGDNAEPALMSLQPENMIPVSQKPPEPVRPTSTALIREKMDKEKAEQEQREEVFNRLQELARQRAEYHPNRSLGQRIGVDATPQLDSDSDGWSD